ncbi:MAG: hypothetical protein AB7T07_03035 [Steroidobacteraceae bacterium]
MCWQAKRLVLRRVGFGLAVLVVFSLTVPGMALAARPNFSGMWNVAEDGRLVISPDDDGHFFTLDPKWDPRNAVPDFRDNFTDETRRRREYFLAHYNRAKDDQAQYCVQNGMPWTMVSRTSDYLFDIYQTSDRITVDYEIHDAHRVIHFRESGPPASFVPNTMGYSVARWEGDTLVIETSGLSARNPLGIKQRSDQMHITERWRLIRHPKFGKALEIDLTVVDPVVYIKPAKGYQLLVPAPAGSTLIMYSCSEALWEDRVHELERLHAR